MNPKTLPRVGDTAVKRCIRYLRVSSKRQMDTDADTVADGNSIDTQRKQCQDKERALGLVCVGEYIEPGNSAQTIAKRPVFRQMMQRIIEEQDVEYVIVYMRSRAFRNALDAMMTKYQLKQMGIKLISAKEDFGEGIYADAMEAMADVFNEVEVRRNGEDIKVKMANKARNGGTVGRAKVGYLNVRISVDGRLVNTIAVDEERRHFILMAFEEFATGRYTVETLGEKLAEAGLRTRGTAKWKSQPVSEETLRGMLRDRYYCGYITYKGVEYKGRHEALISEPLFERVQRVLDSHQGAGVRNRTHHHYLKGLMWCARCARRFIVQRAVGRHGGEYYYFFCIGRQDGSCDHPYVPVEEMEKAVIRYYETEDWLPALLREEQFRAVVRADLEATSTESVSLSEELRQQYSERLKVLDNKESYLLDLAAEEGWPKETLREKIAAIRKERKDITGSLNAAEKQLAVGRHILGHALDFLSDPAGVYVKARNDAVRVALNKAFFVRLMVDGKKVVGHTLREPFDALDGAYRQLQMRSYPRAGSGGSGRQRGGLDGGMAYVATCPTLAEEDGAPVDLSLTDLLALARPLQVRGSSKAVMVEHRRLELLTSCMPCKRSSQLS